ncbi:MAG: biopolymer transporter ExbD [Paramuribaculum sp.]|nr:biopolymer transporter ExbD [Paramuribaculum sp.]MDE7152507.1 biopolymer transporter ExbD [Candidatus Amulumruptor sp.]MDE7237793.1 biopolymer transporter ExbD [Paramuribaculum sp.]
MALKRQFDMTSIFSMASMTDVIFLLLIFFMVTSTFVFPTALEINLPQSSEQTALKPSVRVYIDAEMAMYVSSPDMREPQPVADLDQLIGFLRLMDQQAAESGEDRFIAIYADEGVTYGRLVEVLNAGAVNNLKMVLATKPAPTSALPNAN